MDALLVGGGLAAGGWLLNSKNDLISNDKQEESSQNIYDSGILDTRLLERSAMSTHMDNTNIVTSERPLSGRNTRSLTGEMMSNEQFTHNNMVPFFGSNVKQNTESNNASSTVLENFTGVSKLEKPKQEISPMFENNRENIYGTQKLPESIRDRYNASRFNQGVPITDPIRVGPGLNKGYNAQPSGGFHQADALKYAGQPSVNELRIKTNPKVTYEGRTVNGFKGTRRGMQPVVSQNRVIRFHSYEGTPRLNTTVVNSAGRSTENFIDRETNRQNSLNSYIAPAGPTIHRSHKSQVSNKNQITHRQNLDSFGFRGLGGGKRESRLSVQYCSDSRKEDKKDDTYLGQASSMVTNIIAPLQDILRPTIKETNIHDSSPNRNMASGVQGVPVYDPNDVLRPTIKETNIHDTREGFMGKSKQPIHTYTPDDTTRTTIKETLIHDNRLGPIGGTQSALYQDRPQELKVTARETLKDYINNTNIKGKNKNAVVNTDPLQTTIKETTIDNKYPGLATSVQNKGYTATSVTAPPTNKQFTADNEYSGQATGKMKGGYSVTETNAPPTNKQFTSDNDYTGIAEGEVKPTSYSDIYNATLNEMKEGISRGREPTGSGLKTNATVTEIGNVDTKPGLVQRQTMSAATPIQNIPLDSTNVPLRNGGKCDLESQVNDRNDPNNLNPFKENPYTKSLNSTA